MEFHQKIQSWIFRPVYLKILQWRTHHHYYHTEHIWKHVFIHSKSAKVCGTAFSVKRNCGKVRKSGRHFWAIWGNCGPFWVIFGPLWIILGHSRAIFGHLGSYLGHFGSFLGHFGSFLGHSRAMLDHFGPFGVIFGPLWGILGHFWPFWGIFGQICGNFKFFCGPVGVVGLAFRMYEGHIREVVVTSQTCTCWDWDSQFHLKQDFSDVFNYNTDKKNSYYEFTIWEIFVNP